MWDIPRTQTSLCVGVAVYVNQCPCKHNNPTAIFIDLLQSLHSNCSHNYFISFFDNHLWTWDYLFSFICFWGKHAVACFKAILFKYKLQSFNIIISSVRGNIWILHTQICTRQYFGGAHTPILTKTNLTMMALHDSSIFQDHGQVDRNSSSLANPCLPLKTIIILIPATVVWKPSRLPICFMWQVCYFFLYQMKKFEWYRSHFN